MALRDRAAIYPSRDHLNWGQGHRFVRAGDRFDQLSPRIQWMTRSAWATSFRYKLLSTLNQERFT